MQQLCKDLAKKAEKADLWKHILTHKRKEFYVEIVLSIIGSNSSVEQAFSMLTNMLSDRPLSMKHKRIESVLLISEDDKNWSAGEREEIIERATVI